MTSIVLADLISFLNSFSDYYHWYYKLFAIKKKDVIQVSLARLGAGFGSASEVCSLLVEAGASPTEIKLPHLIQ
jgi:hypothetical protein